MIRRPPRSTLFPYTRSSDLTNGTLAPTLQHPADQRPLAVGTRIVQSIESPLVMKQRDANAVHLDELARDRKSTRLNSSHGYISYAVFCLKKNKHSDDVHEVA